MYNASLVHNSCVSYKLSTSLQDPKGRAPPPQSIELTIIVLQQLRHIGEKINLSA